MTPILLVALALLIVVAGGLLILYVSRKGEGHSSVPPAAGVAEMGYGSGRWERELSLWRGILRRLEIQARHQDPPSARLLAEIEEAQAHIAEAERQLEKK